MNQYSLDRSTMKRIRELDVIDVTTTTLLELLMACHGRQHPLRRNERLVISALSKLSLRFAVRTDTSVSQGRGKLFKYNVLLQSALGRIDITDTGLQLERDEIVENAKRVMTGIIPLDIQRLTHRMLCRSHRGIFETPPVG